VIIFCEYGYSYAKVNDKSGTDISGSAVSAGVIYKF
jgi:hypothetical protein